MALPTRMIAGLTTAMSEGDLGYLQHRVQESLLFQPQETVEQAYEMAREMHPSAPSLKELMAWDRQGPLPSQPPSSESLRRCDV